MKLCQKLFLVKNYNGFYHSGKAAIEKLLEEKSGQITGAFYRQDIGDIDLVWGEVTNPKLHKGFGLSHIIDKHPDFNLDDMPGIIEKGTVSNTRNGFNITYKDFVIGVNDGYKVDGVKVSENRWVVTSFERKKK